MEEEGEGAVLGVPKSVICDITKGFFPELQP